MSLASRPRCDATPAWAVLAAHHRQRFDGADAFDLRRAFTEDARRFERLNLQAPHVLMRLLVGSDMVVMAFLALTRLDRATTWGPRGVDREKSVHQS